MRLVVITSLLSIANLAVADEFKPAPPESVPGYSATVMPCKVERDPWTRVECKNKALDNKTLRELSILRNTIYARYGWDGYRKEWLRNHFHAQPWFKANPKFSYRQLSEADKKNAHFIATREQSFNSSALAGMRDDIMARHKGDTKALTAEEKIELGLIARASGEFALDDSARDKSESGSLDRLLTVDELRQLSLRDLRLLRNTIYARRGRAFKSPILRDHFGRMDWYKLAPDYSDKLLSKNDTRNIQLIRSVEDEFGGPLSDEDWLTEPATDGA